KSAQSFIELWDAVEELDDVQNVYANVEITAEVLEELSAQDAYVQDRSRRSQPVSQLRVCAVDPGLTRCGIAVVDISANRKAELVDVVVVGSPGTDPIGERLAVIDKAMDTWLDKYQPDHLAIERMFAQNNTPTIIGTAQASGVAIAAGA